jgi:uncharacterized membrane protein
MRAINEDATGGAVLSPRFGWSGYLLGFALGGFFDGILLHQILQWHHLLSALEGDRFRDIRVQILADGVFHALMYLVAVIGLWMLWRVRHEFGKPKADRLLFANALIGFGVWHVLDAIFSHWIIGIHRIRMDTPNPLLWDLIWLFAFGIVPLLVGLVLRRGTGSGGLARGKAAATFLAAVVTGGGALASLPPPDISQVMVYFRPGTPAEQVFAAAAAAEGSIIWSDESGELWAFDLPEPSRASTFWHYGALYVGNSWFPAGCLSWSRAARSPPNR